ncbi:MAG TPA: hypothetical protein VK582_05620 [Pyrinomonadaceae bacterium]|nr:hypothetical protein [Pyrinomonadaceae bacterium]
MKCIEVACAEPFGKQPAKLIRLEHDNEKKSHLVAINACRFGRCISNEHPKRVFEFIGVAAGATTDQRGLSRTVDDPGVANALTSDATDIGAFEAARSCNLCCSINISVPNDRGKRGAVVNFEKPSGTDCGRITCDHPSGSFFPVGETIVTCTSSVGPACSFKVTVRDTQAPKITTNGRRSVVAP